MQLPRLRSAFLAIMTVAVANNADAQEMLGTASSLPSYQELDQLARERGLILTDAARSELDDYFIRKFRSVGSVVVNGNTAGNNIDPSAQLQRKSWFDAVFADFSRKLGRLKISVRPPMPPKYIVNINGKEYASDDDTLSYWVVIGATDVLVSREGKPPCKWRGRMTQGGHELQCRL